ncbi:DUF6968 family protein [Archangium sp.]|jgi:hypothetical protein|uniref:DUF6968 family protein n=1 Tax=Archangium sp. TaxID=1872627 RepID=UPI00389A481B
MASESFADRLERSKKASGPIVAERMFELGGRPRAVRVRFRKPRRDPKTGNHWCTFDVSGWEKALSFKVWGVDSLQALQLAMRAAGELLREKGHEMTWCGDQDLGFPRTYPSFLPSSAHSRIERMIDREITKAERPPRRKRLSKVG